MNCNKILNDEVTNIALKVPAKTMVDEFFLKGYSNEELQASKFFNYVK